MATVLVVDDRAASREIARATLDHGGYQVIEASDGHQALRLAKSIHPDLVLTDLLMPGMDGYEFVRELRSHRGTARIPVLFYSANYREDEAHPLATAFGVSKILSKDASPTELLDAVAEALDGRVAPGALTATDFGVQHDHTVNAKLMQTSQALDESQAQLAAMAEASLIGIALAGLDGLATYVNPRLCEITQTPAAGLLGQGWLRCLGQTQRQALYVAGPGQLPPSLDGQHHIERLTLSDGQGRWLSAQIRPVRDSEHAVTGFAATIDDVTAVVDAYERRCGEERERESDATPAGDHPGVAGEPEPGRALGAGARLEDRVADQRMGGGVPAALAARAGSQEQATQACMNAERAKSTAVACGSPAARTSSQSSTYSPSAASQRAAGGDTRSCPNPSGAGWA